MNKEFEIGMRLDEVPGSLGEDVLDSTSPFPHDWERRVRGGASRLVKIIDATALAESVLGSDLVSELNVRAGNASKASADGLDRRIAAISEQAVATLLEKSARVAVSATARQRAIGNIIDKCRQALVTKGFSCESERWSALQQSCEQFVTQSLMVA